MLDAVGASEEQRIHASGIEGRREAAEIGLHPVDPDGVGVDVKERTLAKLRQRLDHTSAGAEKLVALVGNHDARALALLEMALDLVGEVMDVDDRALDALFGEAIEHVVDQRLAADRDQRLGNAAVEGAHARTESGREHHGAFRCGHDRGRFSHLFGFAPEAIKLCLTRARGQYTRH